MRYFTSKNKKIVRCVATIVIVLLLHSVLFLWAVITGSLEMDYARLLKGLFVAYDKDVAVIYDLRFPRIFVAMMAGACLSTAGTLLQAVLKNPLADPGIIGVTSGAGFAAVLVSSCLPGLYLQKPLLCFLGGLIAFALVYMLSWQGGLSPIRIILVGIAIEAMFSGFTTGFEAMAGSTLSSVASITEGNVTLKTWKDVRLLFGYCIPGLVASFLVFGWCNLLSLEDRTVRSLGIHVNRIRLLVSLIAVFLAAIATAQVGAVSFLGLLVPHVGRMLVGNDHKILIPTSMLMGSFVFLLADTLGRTIAAPYEIAPAVIMAVIGGPCFIILLKRSKSYGS